MPGILRCLRSIKPEARRYGHELGRWLIGKNEDVVEKLRRERAHRSARIPNGANIRACKCQLLINRREL